MPRPPRRAAPKRAAATATASVPVTAAALDIEPRATTPSSDIYNVSDREKNAASQRRRSARISTAATDTIAARDHDTALDKPNETLDTSRREEAATPLQGRLADLTGLDMDDSMFNDLNTTYNTIEPASAGPASGSRLRDSSTITASHFKRRPRAGSFLSRDDGPIRPSSRAGPNTPGFSSTFNIGNFKRRAREPSILGTAQKPRARQASRDIESDLDRGLGDDDDDEDSAPEAESTPFKQTKRQSGQGVAKEPTTEPKESRKRKSTEGHTQRDRPSPSITQDRAADQFENSDSELSELEDEEPSLPPMPLATRARQETPNRPSTPGVPSTPIMDEELMAPPLSTDSSEGGDNAWPPVRGQAKGRSRRPALRRTPTRDDSMSDMSSPPSLTHSPNYAEGSSPAQTRQQSGRAAKRKVPPTTARQEIRLPTTAALTGLLPRRRQRNTRAADDSDDEQVDLSGLGADDDELTHLDVRARRRPARGAAARNQLSNAAASNRRKQNNHGPATRKSTRTYGRLSDKENEEAAAGEEENAENAAGQTAEEEIPADDAVREDSQMMVERMGEELKQAARKFQEVDKWSLEYEEAVPASSPNGAR